MAENNEKRTYYIRVSGTLEEVTEEIYRTYYQFKDHQKHLERMERKHGQFSYDALDTSERSGEAMLSDFLAPSVEEIVITHVMYEKLHCSLDKLSQAEKQLVQALYYEGLSEREYAARIGISQKGVNKRKHAIQKNVRKINFLVLNPLSKSP